MAETTMERFASPRQRTRGGGRRSQPGSARGALQIASSRRPAAPVRGYYYEAAVFADADAGIAIARDRCTDAVVGR